MKIVYARLIQNITLHKRDLLRVHHFDLEGSCYLSTIVLYIFLQYNSSVYSLELSNKFISSIVYSQHAK